MGDNIDGEYGLSYQLFVLRRMLEQLPEQVGDNCTSQLDKVEQSISHRENLIKNMILEQLSNLHLEIKSMEFDLSSTRMERDQTKHLADACKEFRSEILNDHELSNDDINYCLNIFDNIIGEYL